MSSRPAAAGRPGGAGATRRPRALAQEPLLLVLDEPTASLDFANQLDLAANGLGVVLSTHHPDQALAVSSHAALLKGGEMAAFGPAREVLTAERLSMLFGVRLTVERAAETLVCVPHPAHRAEQRASTQPVKA